MAEDGSDGLQASLSGACDFYYESGCDQCEGDGRNVEAKGYCSDCEAYLCQECYDTHLRPRTMRHHVLLDEKRMPQKDVGHSKDVCVDPCPDHPEKKLKYVCAQHQDFACGVCVALNHRNCRGLDYIPDVAADVLTSEDYKNHQQKITALIGKTNSSINTAQDNIKISKTLNTEVHQAMNKFKKDLNDAIDRIEGLVLSEADTMTDEDVQKIESLEDKYKDILQSVQDMDARLTSLKNNGQFCQLFVAVRKTPMELARLEANLTDLSKENNVQQFKLVPSEGVKAFIQAPESMVSLKKEASTIVPPPPPPPPPKPTLGATPFKQQNVWSAPAIWKPSTSPKIPPPPPLPTSNPGAPPPPSNPLLHPPSPSFYHIPPPPPSSIPQIPPPPPLQAFSSFTHAATTPSSSAFPPPPRQPPPTATTKPQTARSSTQTISKPLSLFGLTPAPSFSTEPRKPRASQTRGDVRKTRTDHVMDITVRSASDRDTPDITGSVLLPGGRLVVVDFNNNKLKLIELAYVNITAELDLGMWVWDVAKIDHNNVAVMAYKKNVIYVVNVNKKLSIDTVVDVKGKCKGIDCIDKKFVLTFDDPVKVEIVSVTGQVLQTIVGAGKGRQLFGQPRHIAVDNKRKTVYVSDFACECVTALDLAGKVKAVYSDPKLSGPHKLTMNKDGLLYICGYESNNIHVVNSNLEKQEIPLSKSDGVTRPQTISCCDVTGSLYIGMWRSEKIRVYQLTPL